MTIIIDSIYLADRTLRPNLGGINWAVWPSRDVTLPPAESGTGLTTGPDSSLTIPSIANDGIFLLYRNDNDLGGYDTAQITLAVGQPDLLQWSEPFPGFYLLSWQEAPASVEGYIVYRDGLVFGSTTLSVFATTETGTYVVRATKNGQLSPPTNPVTIP